MSSSNCCFLTCIQVSQEAGQGVWYSHLFQNFPQFIVIHTVKYFGIVNKAEIDVFLALSCFFDDPADVGNLLSRSSAFSKTSLNIWKFTVHMLLKPDLENFEHYFTSVWDECNCVVVWAFFGIAFLWDWNENWPFPVLWPLLSSPNLLTFVCSTFTASSFRIWNSSTGIPSPPLALFVVMVSKAYLTSPRIYVFELWYWRRLSRVPWTARRSNQSILKEISPEYSLEGLMLKLKLQYFGHLMRWTDSLEKTLMLGKIERRRRGGRQRMRWLDGTMD